MSQFEVRELVQYPHPALSVPCLPVPEESFGGQALEHVNQVLKLAMDTTREKGVDALAVAAPQCALPWRVFMWRGPGDDCVLLANPEITVAEGVQWNDEQCLSFLGPVEFPTQRYTEGLVLQVRRAARVVMRARSIDGQWMEAEGAGMAAQCWQHEIDHLDGKTYLDRVSAPVRKQALKRWRRMHPVAA